MRNRLIALCLLSLLGSIQAMAQGVHIEKDVAYLPPDRTEKLDLYFPENNDENAKFPAVVIIHGGGWTGGDKGAKREQNIGSNLAQAGYVCASINYVLAEKQEVFTDHLRTVFPQHLQDCQSAVRFLRKNAGKYHINPDKIGAIGGSAGGHLTALLGLVGADDKLDAESPYGEFSCRVQAIVPMYGAHDLVARAKEKNLYDAMSAEDRELCVKASPVTYASKDDPPCLILHGTADALVPVNQSELLHQALKRAGVPVELVIVEGAPHSFHLQPKQRDLRPLVIGFFDQHLKSK